MPDERSNTRRSAEELPQLRRRARQLEARVGRNERLAAEARERTAQLRKLRAAAGKFNKLPDAKGILRALVAASMQATKARCGAAGIVHQGKTVFEEYNADGELRHVRRVFEPKQGVAGRVIQTRRPYVSEGPAREETAAPQTGKTPRVSNLVSVPIVSASGRALGCLELHNKKGRQPFDRRDLEILEALAAMAATAMDRASLREQLQTLQRPLDKAEAELKAIRDNAPLITLLVDKGGRVREASGLAGHEEDAHEEETPVPRIGDALRCINSLRVPAGCGFGPRCRTCDVRRSVLKALDKGRAVRRREASVPSLSTGRVEDAFFLVSAAPLRIGRERLALVWLEDITEQKRSEELRGELEAYFQRAQETEALGVLARDAAYSLHDLLLGIVGYADLAIPQLAATSTARESLERLKSDAVSASETAGLMLQYAGREAPAEPANVNTIVEQAARLVRPLIPGKVNLRLCLREKLPAVTCDCHQVRQAVISLITNAVEATTETGGAIIVRTGALEMSAGERQEYTPRPQADQAKYVFLEVSDAGRGAGQRKDARTFERTFAAGADDRPGLRAVLVTARNHGGAVRVQSRAGEGTTLRVILPAAGPLPGPPAQLAAGADAGRGGKRTVLVVDAEGAVRSVTKTVLERSGFRTLTAGSTSEGIELFRQDADGIAAVLLDTKTAQSEGADAIGEILRARKDAKILLLGDYEEWAAARQLGGRKVAGFIQKPFQFDALLRELRDVLT